MRHRTSRLLLTAALLIAGAGVAAAQGLQSGGGSERGGARVQSRGQSAPPSMRGSAGGGGREMSRGPSRAQMQAPSRVRESSRPAAPRMSRSEGVRSRATVRSETRAAPRATQRSVTRPSAIEQRSRATVRSERTGRREAVRGETRQRATIDRTSRQDRATSRATRDTTVRSRATSDRTVRDRSTVGRGGADVNVRARGDERARAQIRTSRTTITAQQQTRLRQTVLRARHVPRLSRVNFALRAGVIVPRHVRFVSVAAFPAIYAVFPAYRPYSFFVVEDDIVFVDSGYRIVDVVPLEGAGGYATAEVGADDAVAMDVDLDREEIIEVQRVLIAQGYTVRVTGVWDGPTRTALIGFQRRHGIRSVGVFDTRTVAALRLTNRINPRHIRASTGVSTSARDDVSRPRSDRPDAAARRDEPDRSRLQDRATTGRGIADQPRDLRGRSEPGAVQGRSEPNARSAPSQADRAVPSRQPQLGDRNSAPPRATSGQGARDTGRERGRADPGPRY